MMPIRRPDDCDHCCGANTEINCRHHENIRSQEGGTKGRREAGHYYCIAGITDPGAAFYCFLCDPAEPGLLTATACDDGSNYCK